MGIRILKNKRGGFARAGAIPIQRDPLSKLVDSVANHEKTEAALEKARAARARISQVASTAKGHANTVTGAVGKGVSGTAKVVGKTIGWAGKGFFTASLANVNKLFSELFSFAKYVVERFLIPIFFTAKTLTMIIVAILLVSVVTLGVNTYKVYAGGYGTGELANMIIKEPIEKIRNSMNRFGEWWIATIEGTATPAEHDSETQYGILLHINPQKKFMPDEDVKIELSPEVLAFTDDETRQGKFNCELKGLGQAPIVNPKTVNLNEISGILVLCQWPPINTAPDTRYLKAIGTLTYDFTTYASLNVGVIGAKEYDTLYKEFLPRFEHDQIQTKIGVAQATIAPIDAHERAKTQKAPIEIGAEIKGEQPLVEGREQALKFTLYNKGPKSHRGEAIINGIEIDTGNRGIKLTYKGYPIEGNGPYYISREYLESIRLDNMEHFSFGLDTSNFNFHNEDKITKTKIYITVDYTYIVNETVNVEFYTCIDSPILCNTAELEVPPAEATP